MLLQVVEPWNRAAVHDTVGALLRDAAYRRSFWSSIAGRILLEIGRFLAWVFRSVSAIPGGRTAVLTVIAIVLLLVAVRLIMTTQWGEETLLRRKHIGLGGSRLDPWAESERLARAGDFMGAAHALYQAVLRRLAGSERIRVHASKTSGDYVRDLRRRGSPATASFQRFGRHFDAVVFVAGVCTAEDFSELRAQALAIPDRQAAA